MKPRKTPAEVLATSMIVKLRYDATYGVQHLTHDAKNQAAIERLAQESIDKKLSRVDALRMVASALHEWSMGLPL